jgi:hypothetical protein
LKLLIAGSRGVTDPAVLARALAQSPFRSVRPHTIVSGCAPGADSLGEDYAGRLGVPVQRFRAAWGDVDAPGALVRRRRDGTPYNALAGPWRNRDMLAALGPGDGVLVLWNGKSPGSADLVRQARLLKRNGLDITIHVHFTKPDPDPSLLEPR